MIRTRSRSRSSSPRTRHVAPALLVAALVCLLAPALAFAHAVVFPKASAPGAYERYVLRVPNEKAVATVRVELRFPADLRVTSFGDVPGWKLEVLTDSAKRVTGAVWTGTLAAQRFVEFPFVAVNPKGAAQLVWPAFQTYADGERVEWTGAEGSKSPASVTAVGPMPAGASGGPTAGGAAVGADPWSRTPAWVPWTALALALVSLGLALRRTSASRGE